MALLIIAAAGADDASDDMRWPLSLALLERCDACWCIGGPSTGVDEAVVRFLRAGKAVYWSMDAVPPPGARAEGQAPLDPRGDSVMKPFRFGVNL